MATGVDPATIAAITFNARAAEELRERLAPALAPLGVNGVEDGAGGGAGGSVRVRTFHALGPRDPPRRRTAADARAA